jgi:hypothetical protein
MPVIFEFEALTADFHRKLVTQLRNHGAGNEYLEMWVPDENPISSMINMAESALAAGCDDLVIRFSGATMDEAQRRDLLTAASELGSPRIESTPDGFALGVRASSTT